MRSTILFLILLLLALISMSRGDDFPTDLAPTLSYGENYSSFVESDGFGGYQVGTNSKLQIVARCSMKGTDPASFDETTEFTLSCNNLSLDCFLGDDPNYVQGNTSADIPLAGTDPDTGEPTTPGYVHISWTARAVYFTITVINDDADYDLEAQAVVDMDFPGPYDDEPLITLSFGNNSLSRTLYITGNANFMQDPKERVTDDLAKIGLIGQIDSQVPGNVAITDPINGATVNTEPYTVRGTATDNIGVAQVLVSVNGGAGQTASILDASHWSLPGVTFEVGVNKLVVTAIDQDGNTKVARPISVTYSPISALTIQGAGTMPGKVEGSFFKPLLYDPATVPAPIVTSQQKQGKKLTITAVPGVGALFDHWTASTGSLANANSAVLNFEMSPFLTLTANFVVNPFLPIQGKYQGLISSGAPFENGFFTVMLGSTGSFTGTVKLGTLTLPIKGKFRPNEQFTGTFVKGGVTYTVTLQAAATGTNGAGQITGTVTGTNSLNATISSDVAGFKKKTHELNAADVGTYHVLLPAAQSNGNVNYPYGVGYGIVTLNSLGSAKFVGKLGDGTMVTAGATISQGKIWPFYAGLYGGKGVISGAVTLDHSAGSSADLSGTLQWNRPVVAKPIGITKFPTGFSGQSQFLGAFWTAPLPGQLVFLNPSSGAGTVSIDAPVVTSPSLPALSSDNAATLAPGNVVTVTPGNAAEISAIAVSIKASSGTFTGTFTDAAAKKHPFSGLIASPKVNAGGGYFVWGNVTGSVNFTAP